LFDKEGAYKFAPGQSVVWMYQPRAPAQLTILVDSEVVQSGLLRTRIRIWNTQGTPLMLWVKPEKLRPKRPDEPHYFYPDSPKC
jgi:hypothetical protein